MPLRRGFEPIFKIRHVFLRFLVERRPLHQADKRLVQCPSPKPHGSIKIEQIRDVIDRVAEDRDGLSLFRATLETIRQLLP